MSPTRNTAGAPAGAYVPNASRQQPSKAMRELQAGLDVLQQPCSDAAAVTAMRHLKAAGGGNLRSTGTFLNTHELDADTGQILALLNRYLQWYLSGAPTTSSSSSSSSSSSTRGNSRSSSQGDQAACSSAVSDGIVLCLTHISSITGAVATRNTRGVEEHLRPHLVAANTGTMSLVGQAAGVAMPMFARGFAPTTLCTAVVGIWAFAAGVIHPALSPMVAATCATGSTSVITTFNVWRQAPSVAQALPAVADMVHSWMQLPVHMRLAKKPGDVSKGDDYMLSMLVQQLQLLAEGALTAQADKAHTSSSRSSSSSSTSPHLSVEVLFSPAARAQVERFLWHTLATATASLEHHNKSSSSSSSSSRSSSRSSTIKAAITKIPLPPGAGYKVQFDIGNASRASRQATAALLQLAAAALPPEQLAMVHPATAWLRQYSPTEEWEMGLMALSTLLGGGASSSNAAARPALEAAGYICWPFSEAGTPSQPPSSSSSSGGSSSTSRTMSGVDGADPFNNPGAILQLLAAAAAARWKDTQRRMRSMTGGLQQFAPMLFVDGGLGPSGDNNGVHALIHLLLLLVQQLQLAPAQYRDWLLNSCAGSFLFQLMSELRFGEVGQSDTGDWLVRGNTPAAAVLRQQQPAKGDWQPRSALCRILVRKMLLPGLLMQPAQAGAGGSEGADGSSSSSSQAAGSFIAMLDLNKVKPVPLMVVPPAAMRRPPAGFKPPPAAFFMVEQMLREAPLATTFHLAEQLLGSGMAFFVSGQLQQSDHPQSSQSQGDSKEQAQAPLQQLAYCSLASSVVQAVACKQSLAEGGVMELLQMACLLVTADQAAAAQSNSSSSSSSSSSQWRLAASLAAAMGAVACKAANAWLDGTTDEAGQGNSAPFMTTTSSSSSSSSVRSSFSMGGGGSGLAGGSFISAAAMGVLGMNSESIQVCLWGSWLLAALLCLECGAAVPEDAWASVGAEVDKLHTHALQKHLRQRLQQQLLALAWRHPVPGVCGNALCEQREGPSAAGAVKGRVGSLCGGCRAVQYCCEGCQRAAWAAHRQVCGRSG